MVIKNGNEKGGFISRFKLKKGSLYDYNIFKKKDSAREGDTTFVYRINFEEGEFKSILGWPDFRGFGYSGMFNRLGGFQRCRKCRKELSCPGSEMLLTVIFSKYSW